jgi:hypothetical protein
VIEYSEDKVAHSIKALWQSISMVIGI